MLPGGAIGSGDKQPFAVDAQGQAFAHVPAPDGGEVGFSFGVMPAGVVEHGRHDVVGSDDACCTITPIPQEHEDGKG